MSKFDGFINFLEESNDRKLVLSFDFIEKLMGCRLCDSAYQYKEYWQPAGHCLPKYILNSGYIIDEVDLKQEIIVLIK